MLNMYSRNILLLWEKVMCSAQKKVFAIAPGNLICVLQEINWKKLT